MYVVCILLLYVLLHDLLCLKSSATGSAHPQKSNQFVHQSLFCCVIKMPSREILVYYVKEECFKIKYFHGRFC